MGHELRNFKKTKKGQCVCRTRGRGWIGRTLIYQGWGRTRASQGIGGARHAGADQGRGRAVERAGADGRAARAA